MERLWVEERTRALLVRVREMKKISKITRPMKQVGEDETEMMAILKGDTPVNK